ncbi:MAG: Stf0 family sulfotransferase, partial [Pararhodobacter sp.]
FEPFWAGLVHHARQNGIFATKLISHFIRDLETNLTPAEWAMLDGFAQRSRMLYLLRSNKLLQSLSRDRAKSTQNYHLFAAEKREAYRESSQAWTYDFDRIFQEIRRINQEEVYLMGWLCRLFPAKARKPVVYETMDVDVVIRNEARAFRVPASRASVAMPTHVLRDELTVAFAERFREDYRQAFRQDDPETHAAHWLDYDTAADRLVPRTDPDSIVLPV